MTPPGDALDFFEGPSFKADAAKVPGLDIAIRASFAARPDKLRTLGRTLRLGEAAFAGRLYEYLVHRRASNSVYLLAVAEVVDGQGISTAQLNYFKDRFQA